MAKKVVLLFALLLMPTLIASSSGPAHAGQDQEKTSN